ncbi:MAG TPA: methyltransferase domain-containing protein [Steroidobacteraceae bacterium]|nr:methyltransferase domain-containing protein [Steroidobacteraceae bacterium]
MDTGTADGSAKELKHCCARLYESDVAKVLLGDSFHPGGLKLTERLGSLLHLTAGSRVLDVASGTGVSAMFLARRFGCQVIGIDFSRQNTLRANEIAVTEDLAGLVQFQHSDAERMAFADASFDAVICECAFCTFPDKGAAAREFERVLRPGGKVGISDLTRGRELAEQLRGLLAWLACIADARCVDSYLEFLKCAHLRVDNVESHDAALIEMTHQIQMRLLGAQLLVGLKKLDLPAVDFDSARELLRSARDAIQDGQLGYAIITATKPGPDSKSRGHAL